MSSDGPRSFRSSLGIGRAIRVAAGSRALLTASLDFRPVYNAYMKESSVFYCESLSDSVTEPSHPLSSPLLMYLYADIYFLFAGFHIAFCVYMFIGIPSSGSAGLINLISRFAGGHITAGVFCILSTVGWALEGLASLWEFKQVSSALLDFKAIAMADNVFRSSQVWRHSHGDYLL